MSQLAKNYGLKVSLINEDGDEEKFEIVPTVSEEQGNEAVHRIVSYYEGQVAKAELEAERQQEDEN